MIGDGPGSVDGDAKIAVEQALGIQHFAPDKGFGHRRDDLLSLGRVQRAQHIVDGVAVRDLVNAEQAHEGRCRCLVALQAFYLTPGPKAGGDFVNQVTEQVGTKLTGTSD